MLLSGGLPSHNLKRENASTIKNRIDFDLFPQFMKTEEFYEFKKLIENDNNIQKPIIPDSELIFGNHNWLLWLVTSWIGASKIKNESPTKSLLSILSGNPCCIRNFNQTYSEDVLYIYILLIFLAII